MRRLRSNWVACAVLITGLVTGACTSHPVDYKPDGEEPPPLSTERVEQAETVVMPWSHVLEPEDMAHATVNDDSIVLRGALGERAAESFRELDIVVSEDPEQPFLRRVTAVRRKGATTVLETERADLTEALFKGSYETGENAGPDSEKGMARQGLGANYRPLPAGASLTFDGFGIHDPQLSASADPVFDLSPRMHLDFKVKPGNLTKRPNNWKYKGVRSCSSDSDCHRGETCYEGACTFDASGGGDLNAQIDPRPWDDNQHTCAQLVQIMKRLRNDVPCNQKWEEYWSNGGEGSRSDASCPVYRPGIGGKKKIGSLEPLYLSQVEWAKKHCRGTLQSFEFDFRADLKLALKNVSISGSASGWGGDTLKDLPELRFGPYVVTVGWLPVLVTPEYDPSFDYWFGLGGAGEVELANPVGLKEPVELGGGVHYYANAERRENGDFGRGLETGKWHPNDPPDPGVELYPLEVAGNAEVSASATFALDHSMTLLLYETAGPLVQIRAPKTVAAIQGGVSGGPTADGSGSSLCTLGAKVGIGAKAGIAAQMPFCEDCARGSLKWQIWNSCGGGYCGSPNNSLACKKVCFTNDCDASGGGDSGGDSGGGDSGGGDGGPETETVCYDGKDNDGDGKVDCEDPDCPTEERTCDGHDNDCDGRVDEGTIENTCYVDGDGDGYGGRKAGTYCRSCLQVSGAVANNGDCDDSDPDIHPGATESCDGEDEDCDGEVDEGAKNTCYVDGDGDGYGGREAGTYCRPCLQVGGAVANNDDCDDSNVDINPGVSEQCDSATDYDCDGAAQCGDSECDGERCGGRWCQVCISGTCKCP